MANPNIENFDMVVLGGGPGGYVAAVRASQLGYKTALVEKENLGGTCLNWGCIPTKSLLRNAEVAHLLEKGRTFGFEFENLKLDYSVAHKRSRTVVLRQTKRVEFLMKNNKIRVFNGLGRLKNDREVVVESSGECLQTKHIILATGAQPRPLPFAEFDGRSIINYRRALNLKSIPKSAIIVGAGPIGMEFATLWSRYGCKVTVVEMMPFALPLEDEDISLEAQKQFKRNGVTILTETLVQKIEKGDHSVSVIIKKGEESESLSAEMVLISIGFMPTINDIGLENAGVSITNGRIEIDDQMRTSVPNIYAIGDVNGKMGLAHVASAQGVIAAEAIAGKQTTPLIYHNIPRCTYAYPEIASAGLTEKQAKDKGYEVTTAQCPFVANGKAMASEENFGFAKLVADSKTRKILGVHLIGGHVTELVAGPAGLITLESTVEDLAKIVHPHPTLSESIMEAAHAICGHAIHI